MYKLSLSKEGLGNDIHIHYSFEELSIVGTTQSAVERSLAMVKLPT